MQAKGLGPTARIRSRTQRGVAFDKKNGFLAWLQADDTRWWVVIPELRTNRRDTWPMFRTALGQSFWVVLFGTSLALAQDPPPLEGPTSEPLPPKANSRPSAPATKPATPTAAPSPPRPMLVIPGVTAPSRPAEAASLPKVPQPSRSSAPGSPAPTAASEFTPVPSNPGSPFRPGDGKPAERRPGAAVLAAPIPLTLEPLDDETGPDQKNPVYTPPRGGAVRPKASNRAGESDSVPVQTRPVPRRMPAFLGRVFGQPPASLDRDSPNQSEATGRAASRTGTAPGSDAVVKRRIEQQIRATLGDKVQDVEVRVSGRNVLIAGRVTRFWQKRSAIALSSRFPPWRVSGLVSTWTIDGTGEN